MRGQLNSSENNKDNKQLVNIEIESQSINRLSPAEAGDNEFTNALSSGSQHEKVEKKIQSRTTFGSRTDLSDNNDYDTSDDGTVVANSILDDSANENFKSGTVLKVLTEYCLCCQQYYCGL